MVSLFLQKRRAYPELCNNHDVRCALLLTPRLDAQNSFAKLFAVTVVAGPPDPYGLIGMIQTIYCYYYTAHSATWEPDTEIYRCGVKSEAVSRSPTEGTSAAAWSTGSSCASAGQPEPKHALRLALDSEVEAVLDGQQPGNETAGVGTGVAEDRLHQANGRQDVVGPVIEGVDLSVGLPRCAVCSVVVAIDCLDHPDEAIEIWWASNDGDTTGAGQANSGSAVAKLFAAEELGGAKEDDAVCAVSPAA